MKFSLVIPAYNEEESIGAAVRGLRDALGRVEHSFEIIVVNNGSTDGTPRVLEELRADVPELAVVRVDVNRGYGNGVIAGLREAQGEILGWVDADNQVAPEDVAAVYREILHGGADLVKAVRTTRRESRFRRLQSVVYNAIFRILFGGRYRDINAKPKMFRRSLWESLHVTSLDFFIDAEVMIRVIRARRQIREVEVSWAARTSGRSSVQPSAAVEFLKNLLRYKFFRD